MDWLGENLNGRGIFSLFGQFYLLGTDHVTIAQAQVTMDLAYKVEPTLETQLTSETELTSKTVLDAKLP